MSIIYIDIETVPTSSERVITKISEGVRPPGNITKPESIHEWYNKNHEAECIKRHRQTALDGLYGEICSIAWAIDDYPVHCIRSPLPEREILLNWIQSISSPDREPIHLWVGHYLSEFDLRFIWQRLVYHGIKPPMHIPYDAKAWSALVFDTCLAWTGNSSRYTGEKSLQELSAVLLGDEREDISGADVFDSYVAKDYESIERHNTLDVERVRGLYKRMTFATESF